MERRSPIVRSIRAACLLLAGPNHPRVLLQHGLLWDYGGVGWSSAAYWTSLTILDPLVGLFLFVRSSAFVAATARTAWKGVGAARTPLDRTP